MEKGKSEKNKLVTFFQICDELISGKFILSDVKITSLLRSIATSSTLYNLFSHSLVDYNPKEEFNNSISKNKRDGSFIVLPEDNTKIIAYVFHLFVQVDNKVVNFQSFINEYFYNPDGYNLSYTNFSKNILVPFKNAVLELLNIDEAPTDDDSGEDVMQEEKGDSGLKDNAKMCFTKLMVSLSDLYSAVLKDSRVRKEQKEELYIIINALNEATRLQNIKIINALIIPLEYVIGKNKNVRSYYNIVKDDLIEIYKEFS